jgi:hypothetical protein
MPLLPIGLFEGLSGGLPSSGHIRTHAGSAPPDLKLAEYLRSGACFVANGPAFDLVGAGGEPIGPRGLLTDGTSYWPSELAYYVERYGVALPVDFVATAHRQGTVRPFGNEELELLSRRFRDHPS